MTNKFLLITLTLLFAIAAAAQDSAEGAYRMTTQWLGQGKSLDVINDGTNDKLTMAASNEAAGQFWRLTEAEPGFYRLTTVWLGSAKALGVVNDGKNDQVRLAPAANVTGQFWKLTPVGNGYFRLTNKWLGEGKSLDILNDGANNKLRLADSSDAIGQFWKFTQIGKAPRSGTFAELKYSGFTVKIDSALAKTPTAIEALALLSSNLDKLTRILRPTHIQKLRSVPVWIEFKKRSDGAMWYHTSKDWLLENGYPAELENSVEIKDMRLFVDWQKQQPLMTLHEFAHAWEDQFLTEAQAAKLVELFDAASKSGKYEKVKNVSGGTGRHYAMTDKMEYFAEMTEAYFGANDIYPFNRDELREFDPDGYKFVSSVWEP